MAPPSNRQQALEQALEWQPANLAGWWHPGFDPNNVAAQNRLGLTYLNYLCGWRHFVGIFLTTAFRPDLVRWLLTKPETLAVINTPDFQG